MAKKFDKDSFSGTLIVVLVVSLICSIIVAGAVVGLKPIQEKQKLQDKQGYILSVAGLMDKNTDISKTFAERIEQRVVDLATGEYVADAPKDFSARVPAKTLPKASKSNLKTIWQASKAVPNTLRFTW